MYLKPELIKHFYACNMEHYNYIHEIDEDDYPAWNSLNPIMQLNIESAIYKACENLIVGIYGGGNFNDTDLLEYIAEELTPLIDGILLSSKFPHLTFQHN